MTSLNLTMSGHLMVSVLVFRELIAYAARTGLDVEGVMRDLGLSRQQLEDPHLRLPSPIAQRAWAALAHASGDAAFGLHFGQQVETGAYDVFDHAVSHSRTRRDALDQVVRLHRLVSEVIRCQVLDEGRTTRLVHVVGGTHPQNQDSFFATVIGRLSGIGTRSIKARAVMFEHPPQAERALTEFFQCPVQFSRPRSELIFDSQDLEASTREWKPQLAALLGRYGEELLARLPPVGSYADHVRRAVEELIDHEPPTLQAIARRLRASPRTVQRRLANAGTSHVRLVDDMRRELATRYIASSRLSVTEIAFRLGYRDDRSFRRAFKRWTGRSPSAWRGLSGHLADHVRRGGLSRPS